MSKEQKVSRPMQQLILNVVKIAGAEALLNLDSDKPSPELERALTQLVGAVAVLEDKAWRYDELCH